ncbi:hypothetical protein KC906_03000 [Candidatus Kaiserbacteria bacterium]|nr:hypothetical protein [Candidatus Kaiserbacteria bacterium]MCB9812635.1 hypothetical protein [Candidatus Nomurabacteria bacterium]
MSTLSVPLSPELEKFVTQLASQRGSNKAEVVRHAITLLAEEEAVMAVLRAEQEVAEGKVIRGNITDVLRR